MFNKIIKGLKKDGKIKDNKLVSMTPEEQKTITEKVSREIDKILIDNGCELLPVTEIMGSQLRSYIRIIVKPILNKN
jgi:hypothetical protein